MKTPEERANFIKAKHLARFEALIAEAQLLAESPAPLKKSARRMLEITDDLAGRVAPHAACRRGCSHCCWQSVIIPSWEAERIARATGRVPADVPDLVSLGTGAEASAKLSAMRKRFTGIACTFLKDGECSIYAARPMACRTLFNMSDDPTLCDIKARPGGRVPYFNFRALQFWQGLLFFNAQCAVADIREFFPAEITA